MSDVPRRRASAAAERNRAPILDVLRRVLGSGGTLLEIASGTGQHAVHFAAALSGWTWQPSDLDPEALESVAAWRAEASLPNLRAPIALDVEQSDWGIDAVDAIFSANLLHISPWSAALGLLRGAAQRLRGGGPLLIYGPFVVDGIATAPSNLAFDADLRRRDPRWGLRRLAAVLEAAAPHALVLDERVEMPANNQLLVLRRQADPRRDSANFKEP